MPCTTTFGKSASSRMMFADLPPSSCVTRLTVGAAFCATEMPARVERILLRPGAEVQPDTVILELSNDELNQSTLEAELQLRGAEAQLQTIQFLKNVSIGGGLLAIFAAGPGALSVDARRSRADAVHDASARVPA